MHLSCWILSMSFQWLLLLHVDAEEHFWSVSCEYVYSRALTASTFFIYKAAGMQGSVMSILYWFWLVLNDGKLFLAAHICLFILIKILWWGCGRVLLPPVILAMEGSEASCLAFHVWSSLYYVRVCCLPPFNSVTRSRSNPQIIIAVWECCHCLGFGQFLN